MRREIWAADCETDPFKAGRIPAPFIWGAYNGNQYKEFNTVKEFVEFISERKCLVYAHYGGKFDWHFLKDYFESFDPIMVINGRIAKFKIGKAEFRDSYNMIPKPLRDYNKDEFDYSILEKNKRDIPANRIKIQNYLKSDCVHLWNMVIEFISQYGLNLTQAAAALKFWQKLTGIKAPKTSKRFYHSISPYYYGGRVQCFKTGIFHYPFKVIDINSAYPYAMKHLHPFGDSFHVSDELPHSDNYINRSFISVKCISHGALPYRSKRGLVFPDDNKRRLYHITGWEFNTAIETNTIFDWEIVKVITFSDSIRFDEYIDYFYDMKTRAKHENNTANYLFAKLFLNSLYGKFGANPEKYHEYMLIRPSYIAAAEMDGYNFNCMVGHNALCSKPLIDGKSRYYNLAVAASITGFVRAYLFKAIKQCSGVMYCDTDSIACVDTNKLPIDSETLGAWDIEGNFSFGAIAGKKLYGFRDNNNKWKTASKGVRLSPEEIVRVANGEKITYSPEVPTFSLKRGIIFTPRLIKMTS